MSKLLLRVPEQGDFSFRAQRYKLAPGAPIIEIELLRDGKKQGRAKLIQISSSGLAFHSFLTLSPGDTTFARISRFGGFPIEIVRRFDVYNFGAKFLVEPIVQDRLSKKLELLAR